MWCFESGKEIIYEETEKKKSKTRSRENLTDLNTKATETQDADGACFINSYTWVSINQPFD